MQILIRYVKFANCKQWFSILCYNYIVSTLSLLSNYICMTIIIIFRQIKPREYNAFVAHIIYYADDRFIGISWGMWLRFLYGTLFCNYVIYHHLGTICVPMATQYHWYTHKNALMIYIMKIRKWKKWCTNTNHKRFYYFIFRNHNFYVQQ